MKDRWTIYKLKTTQLTYNIQKPGNKQLPGRRTKREPLINLRIFIYYYTLVFGDCHDATPDDWWIKCGGPWLGVYVSAKSGFFEGA